MKIEARKKKKRKGNKIKILTHLKMIFHRKIRNLKIKAVARISCNCFCIIGVTLAFLIYYISSILSFSLFLSFVALFLFIFLLSSLLTLVHSFLCSHHCPYQIIFIPFVCLSHSLLCSYLSFYSHSSSYSCPLLTLVLFLLFLIHFFARQRNESKKGDTGKPSATLSVGFPRDPHPYDITD